MSRSIAASVAPIIAILTGLAAACSPAWGDADENEARQALQRGEIHPLDQVLEVARKRLPGEVVKVKLEHDDGRWTYEIKILTDTGQRREVEIDASSLRILESD